MDLTSEWSSIARLSLLGLPSETLSDILTYLSPRDLTRLMLVSQTLRELAAAQLYRSLRYSFHDLPSHVRDYQVPADKLTALLETLATSDFNYAAYTKSLHLTVARGDDASWTRTQERVAYQFKHDTTNGKFLNTLILAAIKRISTLELFRWDVKVQLNPSIFAALGKFPTLQLVHIRMGTGGSAHSVVSNPPPPPAWAPIPSAAPPLPPPPSVHPHHHAPPPLPSAMVYPSQSVVKSPVRAAAPIASPTFSHFKRLKYLAVLDMESLGDIDEIAECISASSTTLLALKLSFSANLALKARKGPAIVTTSDTDSDTESDDDVYISNNGMPPPPPPPLQMTQTATASNPNHDAIVRNERLAQDRALYRLFDLGKKAPSQERVQKIIKRNIASVEQMARVTPKSGVPTSLDISFMHELYGIVCDLAREEPTLTGNADTVKTAEKLQLATSSFLKQSALNQAVCEDAKKSADENFIVDLEVNLTNGANQKEIEQEPVHLSTADPDNCFAQNPETLNDESNINNGDSESHTSVASSVHAVKNVIEERLLEIVDMEHPDTMSEGEDQEFTETDEDENQGTNSSTRTSPRAQEKEPGFAKGKEPIKGGLKTSSDTSEEPKTDRDSPVWEMSNEEAIQEYIRLNHGIALESLSIQRIPLRTSVICQAINMWSLRRICLLDVGPQRTFWAMLTQLNESNPLRVTSIHSDDVTQTLLTFVGSLRFVDELFLLEKTSDPLGGQSVPGSAVHIEHIREMALKKHMTHLKRLMIRSDVGTTWNLDRRTITLLASGRKLTELVIAVDLPHFHALLHYIDNFTSLVALHILLSAPDYCATLLRELRLCALDVISHFPLLKIQYIAMSHMANGPVATKVSRIKRAFLPFKLPSSNADKITIAVLSKILLGSALKKQKEKQAGSSQPVASNSSTPSLDTDDPAQPTLGTFTMDLHEVSGVKVWQRDIWSSIL